MNDGVSYFLTNVICIVRSSASNKYPQYMYVFVEKYEKYQYFLVKKKKKNVWSYDSGL